MLESTRPINIGIIGGGFVGNSVKKNLGEIFPTKVFDLNPEKSDVKSLDDLVGWADVYFVCVPTPSNEDGSCNIDYVVRVVEEISRKEKKIPIVVKSTVEPGTCEYLSQTFGVSVGFNPEFLTEANAVEDFKKNNIIVGFDHPEVRKILMGIYLSFIFRYRDLCIVELTTKEAEIMKYVSNTFLALKVIYANQIKELCDEVRVDYSKVVNAISKDKRLGATHWMVPGPDGKLGYGGSCFPKDTAAFITFGCYNGVDLTLLREAERVNEFIRE